MTAVTCVDERLAALVGIAWADPDGPGGGRDRAIGLDCLGLVLLGLRELGIDATDPWQHHRQAWRNGPPDDVAPYVPHGWAPVWRCHPTELRVGDVLVMCHGAHVALYAGGWLVLHTRQHSGSQLIPWRRLAGRMQSAWRWQAA